MSIGKIANDFHDAGCNCSQSVICALSGYAGIDIPTAKSVSAAFGGGLRSGELCGALSGAGMALGLACAKDGRGKPDAPVSDLARELTGQFKESYGALDCESLVNMHGRERCSEFIAVCAEIAERLIKKYDPNGIIALEEDR